MDVSMDGFGKEGLMDCKITYLRSQRLGKDFGQCGQMKVGVSSGREALSSGGAIS